MKTEFQFEHIAGERETAQIDIIFVHGLTGDARRTWSNDSDDFWPEWIAEDVNGSCVFSVGYPTRVLEIIIRTEMTLYERAASLVEHLVSMGFGKRPIALIGHSLGGLLVKEMLRVALESRDEDWLSFGNRAELIIFLGTPHRGAPLAKVLNFFFPKIVSSSIGILSNQGSYLNGLFDNFRENAFQNNMQVISYFEKFKTMGLPPLVPRESADPGFTSVRPIGIDANHFDICKPPTKEHPPYPSIVRHIRKVNVRHQGRPSIGKIQALILQKLEDSQKSRENAFDLSFEIFSHVERVLHWSSKIQVLGMVRPRNTSDSTIPLILSSTPRRFLSSLNAVRKEMHESAIVESSENFLILGDPGSGKTTQVKRLLNAMFAENNDVDDNVCAIPILIVAREMKSNYSLHRMIADEIGINYEYREHARKALSEFEDRSETLFERSGDYYFGSLRLENYILSILECINAVIFVDGLDEVAPQHKSSLDSELERLARSPHIRIICTRRSGDYATSRMEGFNTAELCGLTWPDIEDISMRWAQDPDDFTSQLKNAPYADTANRPLLLVQLILIFNSRGELPYQARDVYAQIVHLCLEMWDRERRVVRKSAYAGFSNDRKLEFLSALSYHITYIVKQKRFSHQTLIDSYQTVCGQFRLPAEEAVWVCREIESHSGLIFEGAGFFEFSHLSLQEYLAANHMVRLPPDPRMVHYLASYPAPVAITIALSSNPSGWLASLIYYSKNFADHGLELRGGIQLQEDTVISLLSRIITEKPVFSVDLAFGLALVRLLGSIISLRVFDGTGVTQKIGHDRNIEIVRSFLSIEEVLDSVRLAFDRYFFDTTGNLVSGSSDFFMTRGLASYEAFSGRLPRQISVKRSVVRFLSKEFNVQFKWVSAEEEIIAGPLPF